MGYLFNINGYTAKGDPDEKLVALRKGEVSNHKPGETSRLPVFRASPSHLGPYHCSKALSPAVNLACRASNYPPLVICRLTYPGLRPRRLPRPFGVSPTSLRPHQKHCLIELHLALLPQPWSDISHELNSVINDLRGCFLQHFLFNAKCFIQKEESFYAANSHIRKRR